MNQDCVASGLTPPPSQPFLTVWGNNSDAVLFWEMKHRITSIAPCCSTQPVLDSQVRHVHLLLGHPGRTSTAGVMLHIMGNQFYFYCLGRWA